jgi:hypothetical protein
MVPPLLGEDSNALLGSLCEVGIDELKLLHLSGGGSNPAYHAWYRSL